jgi:co-chaperonin GroES (HSP10)
MKINLLGTNVAISPIFPANMIGHIHIPDQAKDRCKQGIVKFVGPECEYIKPGDYVIFSAYDGTLVKLDDNLYIMMLEKAIQCAVENIPDFDIPGLYLRDKDGYFNGTYSMVMDMLTKGIQDSGWFGDLQKGVKTVHLPRTMEVPK